MKRLSPKDAWNESFRQLREKARSLLKLWDDGRQQTHKDPYVAELLDELKLLHVELDLQNDELLVSRAALEEVRNRYHRFYDLASVAYLTISSKGHLIDCNKKGAELLSLTRDEITKKTPLLTSLVSSKKDVTELKRHLGNYFTDRKPVSLIIPLKGSSKPKMLIRLDFLPVQEGSKADQVLVLARDVTEELGWLKQAAQTSRAFLSLASKKSVPLWVVDQKGEILFSADSSKITGKRNSLKECLQAKDWNHFKMEVAEILEKNKQDVTKQSGSTLQVLPLDLKQSTGTFLVFRR